MQIVKVIEDAMEYSELGTLVLLDDDVNISSLQDDIDLTVQQLDDMGAEWYVSDIVNSLKDMGYKCEFFYDEFTGTVMV